MSTQAKIGIAVGLLLVAGLLYFLRAGNETNDLTSRTEYNARIKCRSCAAESKVELNVADMPPFACDKCGKTEAWKLFRCNACGHEFVPDPVGNPPRPPMIPVCPKCNGQSTGGAPAD